jgi:hypothetical protein
MPAYGNAGFDSPTPPGQTLIVASIETVNNALARDRYFFRDIKKEGILLPVHVRESDLKESFLTPQKMGNVRVRPWNSGASAR